MMKRLWPMNRRETQALLGLVLASAAVGMELGSPEWGVAVFGAGLVLTTIPGWFK